MNINQGVFVKSKLIVFCSAVVFTLFSYAQSDNMKTYVYQAYEDSDFVEQFPFEIVIEANSDFSQVNKIVIKETKNNILFFELSRNQIKSFIEDGIIKIQDTVENLKPINDKGYSNYYGDTDISQDYTYAIYLEFYKNDDNKLEIGRIEIANNDQQEMALWGDLKLK